MHPPVLCKLHSSSNPTEKYVTELGEEHCAADSNSSLSAIIQNQTYVHMNFPAPTLTTTIIFLFLMAGTLIVYHWPYYYRYSALGPVWAENRAQSGDWYGSGMLHPGQVLRGSLPLLSSAFRRSHVRHQVPPRPPRRVRS